MTRSLVSMRDAELEDAPFLAEIWVGSLRKVDAEEQVHDVEQVVKDCLESAEQRIVVAEYDGAPAGAVYVRISTITPLNREPAVLVLSPHVLPAYRRHGIGRMLMEAAATFAEESGVPTMCTAVNSGSRDGNRFMARLSLGPLATYRTAPTAAVRARLTAQRPALTPSATGGRQITRVLAARRSMRRTQPPAAG